MGSQYPLSPEWDEARAAWLVGKVALVGMTRFASDGQTVLAKQQYHGVIEACDREIGIRIACKGVGQIENVMLPPITTPFLDAKPGEYRLRSTGEIIRNPDVTVSWTITEPRATEPQA
jgi:hypothetical protein